MIHIDAKMVLTVNRFDQQSQRRMIDLLDSVALATDQMMMWFIPSDLIVCPVAPAQRMNQAQLAQEIQRAINHRVTDSRILLVHHGIDLLRCDVHSSFANNIQNEMALRRQPIPLRVKPIDEIDVSV